MPVPLFKKIIHFYSRLTNIKEIQVVKRIETLFLFFRIWERSETWNETERVFRSLPTAHTQFEIPFMRFKAIKFNSNRAVQKGNAIKLKRAGGSH